MHPRHETSNCTVSEGGRAGGPAPSSRSNTPGNGRPQPRLGRSGNSFVNDQAALYERREFKPAWFERAEVEANAVRSYRVPRD